MHDNGSNVVSIARKVDTTWNDVACTAHTLLLCINAATRFNDSSSQNVIARCVFAASRLVTHFHHSTLATSELYKRQEKLLLTEEKVTEDVSMYNHFA